MQKTIKLLALIVALFALSLVSFACGSSNNPPALEKSTTSNNEVAPDEVGERYLDSEGGFSYSPPVGWQLGELPGIKYKLAYGPKIDSFSLNINVVDELYSGSLDEYVSANLEAMRNAFKDFKLVSQEDFLTDIGERGVKIIQENTQNDIRLHQSQYFFEVGNKKFVVTYTRLVEKGEENDILVDQSLKTFRGEE